MKIPADDLAQLSRLLDEALEQAPEGREPWLAALAEQRLVPMLRQMLQDAGSTASAGLGLAPMLEVWDAAVGERIGPYRLLREFGRGGMGTVWLAEREDGSFKRRVALKLPRLAWGSGLAERMTRERDIGARLEHPNIARLYDAGVDDKGRPFLAFEFIDGVAMDEWCQVQGLRAQQTVALFLQVVRAVAYAHARLVVHRDLKPSNVLVTPDGQAHLLDFGIAKLQEESALAEPTEVTREHGRPLTPYYASPEQLRGEALTVGSDVFSLGVMLYVLLARQHPYGLQRVDASGLERAMQEGPPPPVSSRVGAAEAKALRGGLDAIIAQAVAADPGARYATAHALAEDIARYLDGERVLAESDTVFKRVRRALRRHRLRFGIGMTALVALVAVTSVTLIQARRTAEAAERARVVQEFVVDLLKIGAPGTAGGAEVRTLPADLLLERGARLIETRFKGQPRVQAEMHGVVGQIFADMGASSLAAQYGKLQVEALAALEAPKAERARALMLLAHARNGEGRLREAHEHAMEAMRFSGESPDLQARTKVLRAQILLARNLAKEAAQALEEFDRDHPQESGANAARALARSLRAELMARAGNLEEALVVFRQAIGEALTVEGASSIIAVDARTSAARHATAEMRFREADEFLQPALATLRASGSAGVVRAALVELRLAGNSYRVSTTPGSTGGMKFAEYRRVYERTQRELAHLGVGIPEAVQARMQFLFATTTLLWGDVQNAAPLIVRSVATLQDAQDAPILPNPAAYQGHAAMYFGRHTEAESHFRKLLDDERYEVESRAAESHTPYVFLAVNYSMAGRFDQAFAVLESAPDYRQAPSRGPFGGDAVIDLQSTRAQIHLDRGNPAAALDAMPPESEDKLDILFPWSNQRVLRGEILCALGRRKAGLSLMLASIDEYARRDVFVHHADLARARAIAGLCALADGNRPLARQLAAQARTAFAAQPDIGHYHRKASRELDSRLERSSTKILP